LHICALEVAGQNPPALFTGVAVALLCAVHRMATQRLVKETTAAGELIAYAVDRRYIENPLPQIPRVEQGRGARLRARRP
jgi:hypothetical protein